ncbi:MAG TPA: NTP transferase domain-containing protein [Mycobacteriales bacterium]|nr:NTP transferase domain-containing protein [Mycobacteriales bacterium]
MPEPAPATTAVVLCGGASRRMGADKTAATLGATTVLDHLLDALPAAWPVVAVGPERPTRRVVRWTRESPPGGGPVAAVAAGLSLVDTELVVVLAGDMPFAAGTAARLAALLQVDRTTDAVVAVDPSRRANPLLAAYRSAALRAALPHPPANAPARSLLAVPHIMVSVDEADSLDVDTPEALAAALRSAAWTDERGPVQG